MQQVSERDVRGRRVPLLDVDEARARALDVGVPDGMAELNVFRILFESTVRRCIREGLIGGKDAAIDASFIAADASWQRKTVPGYLPYVANASRAVREWVHDTGDAVFEMARSKSCQGISRTDPAAAWSARTVRGRFGYALNALVDTPSGVALDVEATPAR